LLLRLGYFISIFLDPPILFELAVDRKIDKMSCPLCGMYVRPGAIFLGKYPFFLAFFNGIYKVGSELIPKGLIVKIIGFMGSPRFGGNSDLLLDAFLKGAKSGGAETKKINLYGMKISPCIECGGCDETGVCVLKDDMTGLYEELAAADVVVVSSPMFFYNITSRTQALVERSQACWTGKYFLKRGLLGGKKRKGVFLSVGATKGKFLFEGALKVMKYFFDAIDGEFAVALLYRGVEAKGAIKDHPSALRQAEELGRVLAQEREASSLDYVVIP